MNTDRHLNNADFFFVKEALKQSGQFVLELPRNAKDVALLLSKTLDSHFIVI